MENLPRGLDCKSLKKSGREKRPEPRPKKTPTFWKFFKVLAISPIFIFGGFKGLCAAKELAGSGAARLPARSHWLGSGRSHWRLGGELTQGWAQPRTSDRGTFGGGPWAKSGVWRFKARSLTRATRTQQRRWAGGGLLPFFRGRARFARALFFIILLL